MHLSRTRALCVLASIAAVSSQAAAQIDMLSPLSARPRDGLLEVTIDPAGLDRLLEQHADVRLTGFPMPDGREVDLLLEPFDVLTRDGVVVLGTADGDVEIGRPDVSLFRGRVAGELGSRVFLSFSPYGTHGLVQTAGTTAVLSSGAFGSGSPLVIADLADFPELPEFAKGWECHVGPEHVINPLGLELPDGGADPATNPCRIARIAIESDYEYTAWLFGGNLDASAAYAITLLGAVGEIYTRDLNVRLLVPFVRVWAEDNDPYIGGDKLSEFQAEWHANMRHIDRELAHMLSGNYGGGVAWVSVLCHNTWGYGLSGVAGGFPYPLRDHDGGNWDVFVVPHELGHNFGTLHTHDGYDPVIDGCGLGDCSDAWGGTIMSYCHTCPGGMNNIVLAFHPRVITQISSYLDGACNILGDGDAYTYDDSFFVLQNVPTRLDVLANEMDINCAEPGIFTVQATTDQGGAATISEGTGEGGRDEVLYTSPAGFTGADTFFYIMQTANGAAATGYVSVEVLEVRPADQLGTSRPGLAVAYYDLPGAEQLPDFSTLTPYARDYLPEINFPRGYGFFATSGRVEYVGAVFHAHVRIPETGYYTLSVESDDGSRLSLGDEVLIENDGVHGMTERAAGRALEQGWHRLTVEFFEQTGTQGLITRIEGPGIPKQPIPPDMWRTSHCVADWSPDGVVNTIDFIVFLTDWNLRDPATDLDANGLINTADVIRFLGAWAQGCP